MFGAIWHVESWIRYRKRLAAQWSRDVDRLLREEARRARKRRNQRGRWLDV